jgi:hypothetical protein
MQTAQQEEQQQAAHTVLRAGPMGVPLARQQQGLMAGPRVRMGQRMVAPLGRHMVGQQEARMAGPQVGDTVIVLREHMLCAVAVSCCASGGTE